VSIDPTRYRQIIGHFATGVTVVTTHEGGLFHGFTANAVSSVSLDPLLLLVCVEKTAFAHEELLKAKAFGVNILTREQEDLSNLFAQRGDPVPDSLRGVPTTPGELTGVPIIDGALAYCECERDETLEGGDHAIFLGRVVAGDARVDADPLLYFRGGYRSIGE
jgi:flavin reductase (DIM6/NTAB) family NADH-FMN oxidoreductase RutF